MLRVEALRARFVDVGRPEHEWELFFTRTLRDGMALTAGRRGSPVRRGGPGRAAHHHRAPAVRGGARPRAAAASASCRRTRTWSRRCMALARARVPAYAFTHGTGAVACDALDRAGLRTYLRGVLSTEEIRAFKPPARVYHWACQQVAGAGRPGARWSPRTPGTCTAPCGPGWSARWPPGWRVRCRRWWPARTWRRAAGRGRRPAAGAAGLTPAARTDPGRAGRRGRGLGWSGPCPIPPRTARPRGPSRRPPGCTASPTRTAG